MKLPDIIFGKNTRGAYEKYLEDSEKELRQEEKETSKITPASGDIPNLDKDIMLEGKQHGSYSYPDLLVGMERSHHGKDWYKTHEALNQEGMYMLTIRQFADFLSLLKSGKAFDGRGNKIDKARLDSILDEILTVRSPYRAEWLDTKFSESGGKWSITYHKIRGDGTSEEVTEPLEECLREDKIPGIDLDSWLKYATSQGLPSRNTSDGSLYYWHPIKDRVAGFDAFSEWAGLDWDRLPVGSSASLGVRAAKIRK